MKTTLTVLAGVAAWLLATAPAVAQEKKKNEIPSAVEKVLRDGGKLEVLYLSGDRDKENGFHGFAIEGKPVEVSDAKEREKLVDALVKGVADSDLVGPREFGKPGHGLRVRSKDGKEDVGILLSLDNAWGFVYQDGKQVGQFRLTEKPRKSLDALKSK